MTKVICDSKASEECLRSIFTLKIKRPVGNFVMNVSRKERPTISILLLSLRLIANNFSASPLRILKLSINRWSRNVRKIFVCFLRHHAGDERVFNCQTTIISTFFLFVSSLIDTIPATMKWFTSLLPFRVIYFLWWSTWTEVILCFTFSKVEDSLRSERGSTEQRLYQDSSFSIEKESFIGKKRTYFFLCSPLTEMYNIFLATLNSTTFFSITTVTLELLTLECVNLKSIWTKLLVSLPIPKTCAWIFELIKCFSFYQRFFLRHTWLYGTRDNKSNIFSFVERWILVWKVSVHSGWNFR